MIRLHHVQYGRSFRVLWLLEEIGIETFGGLEVIEHQIGSAAMRESDLGRVSPATRIPAIEYKGLEMSESGAIVEYLTETYAPELNRRIGDPERASWLQWVHYSETMASLIEQLNLQMVFLRPPAKPSPIVIKLNVARLRQTLAGMEARLSGDWLLPGGFSAADIMMGFNLFAAPFYVKLDEFPKLQAYKARMEARPAYQRCIAREGAQRFYAQDFYPVPEA
ncbi:glutathione S-transferase family protein [Tropicibacter naphthalenivorans]|uniref:Glutathione S-transferase n=1 Tax=Tropicibacter naphthalenivorans TaxID=441103 RepID=A0A0P1GW54_9RHOB|nr:glutathione S-transferase family protein [Tropicibacter naphthalenivorans]CUH80260.1 glutathione S-transferase [Tropicibacter naphthalenivorans]SMC85683.1 glutathione S-transferase [Tropicibacter naphthalenivorans]